MIKRPMWFAWLAFMAPAASQARPALSYLTGQGARTYPVVRLTWGLIGISIAVCVVMTALVVWGVLRRRVAAATPIGNVPVERGQNGLSWIYVGGGISTFVLFLTVIWTVSVLAAVGGVPRDAALTVEVTGQQWWWKFRYMDDQPYRIFTTADELHIPVGRPVRVRLIGADVIHAFWVPALTGKMQTIPGVQNETWLEADRPGRYWGACTQYCGQQHAHMALVVVAETPDAFEAWRNRQIAPAPQPVTQEQIAGLHEVEYRCGTCHSVRGTDAGGTVAPDLTHVMGRSIIAGGVVPNTIGNLTGWIANPPALKPGTLMPVMDMSGPELHAITAYLTTLK